MFLCYVVEHGDKTHFLHDKRINQFTSLFAVSSAYLLYQGIFVLLLICFIMVNYWLVSLLALFVVCLFCGSYFKSLGRHACCCKERLRSTNHEDPIHRNSHSPCNVPISFTFDSNDHVSNCTSVKCCCGKVYDGLHGVQMHQRSCHFITSLASKTFDIEGQTDTDTGQIHNNVNWNSLPSIKAGIKLPKSDAQWQAANMYFAGAMPVYGIGKSHINDTLSAMKSISYNYFRDTCRLLEVTDASHLDNKYKDLTNASLKTQRKNLKRCNAHLAEIRFVAKLLRSKLRDFSKQHNVSIDHDKQIKRNVLGLCQIIF